MTQKIWTERFGAAVAYGSALALTTPTLMGMGTSTMLGRYPCWRNVPRFVLKSYPPQVTMRLGQLGLTTAVHQVADSPWVAFGTMGVSQGIVYGHANVAWVNMIKQTSILRVSNCLRGSPFAALRDMASQGIPFHFRHSHPLVFGAVTVGSVVGTQGLHNLQVFMQTYPRPLSHRATVRLAWQEYKWQLFTCGAPHRLVVMGLVNILNRQFLDQVWT